LIKERISIYKGFSIDLLNTISEFYLDKQTLNNDKDIRNHYNWCYNKTCEKYLILNYNFYYNETLKNYFYSYYYDNIYKSEKKLNTALFKEFWENIFNVSTNKDKNIRTIFSDIYAIFDKSVIIGISKIIVDDEIITEKDKSNQITQNIDNNKFNKIYEFKYSENTIALGELKNGNLVFVNKDGLESVLNISDSEIENMDSYIRAIYFNQLISDKLYYVVTPFTYENNLFALAETIKGKKVYINKLGNIIKLKV
jgi:hypothetical protein